MTDLHTHTYLSDGDLDQSPDTLCRQAKEAGIHHLSITDHDNILPMSVLNALAEKYQLDLVSGCEFSSFWKYDDDDVIVHLGDHFLYEKDKTIQQIIRHNQNQPFDVYVKEMLYLYSKQHPHPALRDLDAAYEELRKMHPHSQHLGKRAAVHFLLSKGCASHPEEVYQHFAYGGAAHVSPTKIFRYAPLEEVVQAITKHSVCTLNHLYYSHLNDAGNHALLKTFKELGGQALETVYSHYDQTKQKTLFRLCDEYDLLPNCGSDRHDTSREFLHGSELLFQRLKDRQLRQYGTLNDEEETR